MKNSWLKVAKEITLKRNEDGTHDVIVKIDMQDKNKIIKEADIKLKANITDFEMNILFTNDDNIFTLET